MDYGSKLLIPLLSLILAGSGPSRMRWTVYYSDRAQSEEFRGYDLVVFDSDRHPALRPIEAGGSKVLGYLSLCEVEQYRSWFEALKRAGVLVGENPNWPGSYLVDVRDATWRHTITSQLVPAIMAQGFQGVFLDTLDDAAELERRDPEKFRGMKAAATTLVKEIRRAIPASTLMVNRGYDVLPEIARDIDIALGESVYGTYDFSRKVYHPVPEAEYRHQVDLLEALRSLNPSLRIFTLDYWDPADLDGIRRIYRAERANGFHPYVATLSLDQLMKEPH